MFVKVLIFPFTHTNSNVNPCRRAWRSGNDNLVVLCSTISDSGPECPACPLRHSEFCWNNNVGGSISISFDVQEQELEFMVEHI